MGVVSRGNGDVLPWLKSMPVVPKYQSSAAEFQDPISYIFKIEKEASKYEICKIIPPFQPSSTKTAIANLNRSLAETGSTFTTRQQQIGFSPHRPRPFRRPVWQIGFTEFVSKSKSFKKTYLKRLTKKVSDLSSGPLETEMLFWKMTLDIPQCVWICDP